MHLRLTKSHLIMFVSEGISTYRIILKSDGVRSGGFWTVPVFFVFCPGSWFQDLQAV
jgi:hypothetical protein